MKKILSSFTVAVLLVSNVHASIEDTQLKDVEKIQELKTEIKMKKFNSCEDFKSVLGKYLKEYYKTNHYYPMYRGGGMLEDAITNSKSEAKKEAGNSADSKDFSQTNNQVAGVDEEDIIKTDGDKIYYYNSKDGNIYVIKANGKEKSQILKKIVLPNSFADAKIYVEGNKLAIISNNYDNGSYSHYWFNRQTKTAVAVYDLTNIENPKLDRYFKVDGNSIDTRKIGNKLYLITNSSISLPEYLFDKNGNFLDSKANSEFSKSNILPKKYEIINTKNTKEQNLVLKGKIYPYNIKSDVTADCSNIEYVLPDFDSASGLNISPSFTIVSTINLANPQEETKTKSIFGDIGTVYMSTKNLYITSTIFTNYSFKCPKGAYCILPYYESGRNTLVHKLNLTNGSVSYNNSTVISGTPLNQYSMDEKGDNFRIITQYNENMNPWVSRTAKKETQLFVLDKDLKPVSKLTGIGVGEDFKSSRFIGDKLYLVTFETIDPLFVIDLSDEKNPKILGELKIPGYSTYLHPYDENHLIGLGYDTFENKHGGVQNGGIKISLFDVSDLKNPKEKSSTILGDNGSYSEALYNPRMFVWNKNKKTLLLPATVYTQKSKDSYGYASAKQGSYLIGIDKETGVTNKGFITHIDTTGAEKERNEECSKYTDTEKKCTILLNGKEYCYSTNSYVPEYCFKDSKVDEYIANNIWKYNDDFINRNLYIGDNIYTFSNSTMKVNDFGTKELDKLNLAPKTQENKEALYIK